MKTIKTVLGATSAALMMIGMSVYAVEALSSPRSLDVKIRTVSTGSKDTDYVQQETTLGNAAKSKAAGPRVIAVTGKNDPDLLACARLGKATCAKNPCDMTMNAACCKK